MIRFFIIAACFILWANSASAGCAVPCTQNQLLTEINTNWADNTTNNITPTLLRAPVYDIVNTYFSLLSTLNASNLSSGTIPAARTNGHQNGTATNDNAAAGEIGEFISSTVLVGSAVSLTNSTAANITSVSLTAGDWDCSGLTVSNPNAATTQSGNYGWISSVSATVPTAPNNGGLGAAVYAAPAGSAVMVTIPTHRISLASTTTTYLGTLSIFAVNTNSAYGWIGCRRAR